MCFPINPDAKRPVQRTVWKILQQEDDVLLSPFLAYQKRAGNTYSMPFSLLIQLPMDADQWTLRVAKNDPNTQSNMFDSNGYSLRGLYVYLNEQTARDDLVNFWHRHFSAPKLVLVECLVHPVDWLYTSLDDGASKNTATYRVVTPWKIIAKRTGQYFDGGVENV